MLTEDKMLTCEMSNLIKDEKGEEETRFYQAAFNSFDWNHSGRIATSVSYNFHWGDSGNVALAQWGTCGGNVN